VNDDKLPKKQGQDMGDTANSAKMGGPMHAAPWIGRELKGVSWKSGR
jgi:hypothetical protein